MKDMINLGLRLMVVALLAGLLLAVTNYVTQGPIAMQQEATENDARVAVMPQGGDFEEVEGSFDGIEEVNRNEAGYVFDIIGHGYGSDGVKVTVGVLNSGEISGIRIDASSETPGLGTKAADESYYGQYTGKTAGDVDGISAISGATVTSNAVKGAVKLALDTFEASFREGGAAR